jgi:hypothetical protein
MQPAWSASTARGQAAAALVWALVCGLVAATYLGGFATPAAAPSGAAIVAVCLVSALIGITPYLWALGTHQQLRYPPVGSWLGTTVGWQVLAASIASCISHLVLLVLGEQLASPATMTAFLLVPFVEAVAHLALKRGLGGPLPGQVFWADVYFEEDPLQSKDRPVMVLGPTADGHIATMKFTSVDQSSRGDQYTRVEGWQPAPLKEGGSTKTRSWADLTTAKVLDRSSFRRADGRVPRKEFERLVSLASDQAWSHPPAWVVVGVGRLWAIGGVVVAVVVTTIRP